MNELPLGFEPHFRKSPATNPWEPLYSRRRNDGVDICFDVRDAHCNSRGLLHGGVLSALLDNAMGLSIATQLSDARPHIVTVNLSVDFLSSAKVGDRVVIAPRVVRIGGQLATCDALATLERATDAPNLLARANATFSVRTASASPQKQE